MTSIAPVTPESALRQIFEPLFPAGCNVRSRSIKTGLFLVAGTVVAFTGVFENVDSIINIPLKFINFFKTGRLDEWSDRRFSERCQNDSEYAGLYGYRDPIRNILQVGLIAGGVYQHFLNNRKYVKGKGLIPLRASIGWTALSLMMNLVVRMIADGAGNAMLRPTSGNTSPWNPRNYRLEDFCTNLFVSTWSLAIFFNPFFAIGTQIAVNTTEHCYKKITKGPLPFFALEKLPDDFIKPTLGRALFSGSTLGYLGLLIFFTGAASGIGTCMIRSSQEYEDRSYYKWEFIRSYWSMMPSRLLLIGWMLASRGPMSIYFYNLPSLLLTIYPFSTPNSTKEAGSQKYRELVQDYIYASSPEKKARNKQRLMAKEKEILDGARRIGFRHQTHPFVKQWDEVQKIKYRYSIEEKDTPHFDQLLPV